MNYLYCLFCLFLAFSLESQKNPNIIIMLADNLGYGDLGCYGGGIIRGAPTPNIDRIAQEGIRFTNFNVEAECTPSRSALMTGRYAVRSGTTRAVPIQGLPQGLAPWEVTIAEILKQKGYSTAIYGKWHIGVEPDRLPTNQGFDEWWGITNSTDVVSWPGRIGYDPAQTRQFHVLKGTAKGGVEPVMPYDLKARKVMDQVIEEKAVSFIKEHAEDERPFLLYLPWIAVHHPPLPNEDYKGASGNGAFADMVVEHDDRVGNVMQALKDYKIDESTIVIYASDNGPDRAYFPDIGDSGPFRGYLGGVHEGSIRTPLLIRWPQKIRPGQVSNEIVSITDIFPSIAALVAGNIPMDRAIDGADQTKLFFENSGISNRDGVLFFHEESLAAIKWRQFKIYFANEGVGQEERSYSKLWAPQVYNLLKDPKELDDIALQNLWILSPALRQLVPFYISVKNYGLIQAGSEAPMPGEIEIPFVKSDHLNKMFQKMMQAESGKQK